MFSPCREYFEDRIGPVSFDFVKTSADQQRLFVAVRFETRDDAKEAMSKIFADTRSIKVSINKDVEDPYFEEAISTTTIVAVVEIHQEGVILTVMMIEVVHDHEIEVVLQAIADLQVGNLVIHQEVALVAVKGQPAKIVIDDLLLETQTLLRVVKRTVTETRIGNIVRRTKNTRNRKIFKNLISPLIIIIHSLKERRSVADPVLEALLKIVLQHRSKQYLVAMHQLGLLYRLIKRTLPVLVLLLLLIRLQRQIQNSLMRI
ncbi:hypothetical protein ANCCAN_23410 [Ancylostoma caninum]|uniref:RRM domain-containing protein n=1 Tax=Ancylostoma caninum TaxID=29170 RepID=A0A368FF35_ANCCA|nr:hypothetical protein ANCCAN_23410 [Ancylostoma caninum]